MLRRASAWLREARIRFSFISFEQTRRREHLAHADERFPVSKLENEIAGLRDVAQKTASETFGAEIEAARNRRSAAVEQVGLRRSEVQLLRHDLDAELRSVKTLLNSKHQVLSRLKRERHHAEQDKSAAAREISDWHHSTKNWLGQRKPIPQHSFFGRSWAELDSLKDHLGDRVESVLDISDRIGSVNTEILELEDWRASILKARELKRGLVRRGVTNQILQRAIAIIEDDKKE